MSALQSLRAWTNPDWPSTPTYGALARFGLRRGGLVTALGIAGQFAVLLPGGFYAPLALLVGAIVAGGVGYLAGAAIAFDDHGRAAVAATASAGVLLATGVTMRALDPIDDLVVGPLAFGALAPLALGVLGYTAAERALWQAED
jgi:hypothetical protein